MEVLKRLGDFYEAIDSDARVGGSHICLYIALLHEWFSTGMKNPIHIRRNVLMKNARIGRKTYNKCMKDMQEFGYIRYLPSMNALEKSKVYLKKL